MLSWLEPQSSGKRHDDENLQSTCSRQAQIMYKLVINIVQY